MKREEEFEKIEAEKEKIKLLEKLETQMLDRLKNTALRQQIAQEQYEYSRKNDPVEFEKKFGIERAQEVDRVATQPVYATLPTQPRDRNYT